MSEWKEVCAVADLPENEIRKFDISGIEFVVTNYGSGIQAFPPFCPHMLEPLVASGMMDSGVLTCGKHLWQWDLATGKGSGLSEKDLLIYDTKQEDGKLFVDLSEELTYEWDEEDELDDDDFFNS